jgi:hypothetical protein
VLTGLGETGSVSVVSLLGLDGGQVLDRLVGPLGVEPVDPVQGGCLDVVYAFPRAVGVDEFGLVQAHVGLGQGVVVGVADGSNRGVDALVDQGLGERDRGVLGRRRCGGPVRSGR